MSEILSRPQYDGDPSWINAVVKMIFFHIGQPYVIDKTKNYIQTMLDNLQFPEYVEYLKVSSLTFGSTPPQINSIKATTSPDQMCVVVIGDLSIISQSHLQFSAGVRKLIQLHIPLRVSDLAVQAKVRIALYFNSGSNLKGDVYKYPHQVHISLLHPDEDIKTEVGNLQRLSSPFKKTNWISQFYPVNKIPRNRKLHSKIVRREIDRILDLAKDNPYVADYYSNYVTKWLVEVKNNQFKVAKHVENHPEQDFPEEYISKTLSKMSNRSWNKLMTPRKLPVAKLSISALNTKVVDSIPYFKDWLHSRLQEILILPFCHPNGAVWNLDSGEWNFIDVSQPPIVPRLPVASTSKAPSLSSTPIPQTILTSSPTIPSSKKTVVRSNSKSKSDTGSSPMVTSIPIPIVQNRSSSTHSSAANLVPNSLNNQVLTRGIKQSSIPRSQSAQVLASSNSGKPRGLSSRIPIPIIQGQGQSQSQTQPYSKSSSRVAKVLPPKPSTKSRKKVQTNGRPVQHQSSLRPSKAPMSIEKDPKNPFLPSPEASKDGEQSELISPRRQKLKNRFSRFARSGFSAISEFADRVLQDSDEDEPSNQQLTNRNGLSRSTSPTKPSKPSTLLPPSGKAVPPPILPTQNSNPVIDSKQKTEKLTKGTNTPPPRPVSNQDAQKGQLPKRLSRDDLALLNRAKPMKIPITSNDEFALSPQDLQQLVDKNAQPIK